MPAGAGRLEDSAAGRIQSGTNDGQSAVHHSSMSTLERGIREIRPGGGKRVVHRKAGTRRHPPAARLERRTVSFGAEGTASENQSAGGWSIDQAEDLLRSLTGVLSARMVARPGGDIQEIHLLTTEEVAPKQTVRNVESALLAHMGLTVDHRKISVAQTRAGDGDGDDGEDMLIEALPSRREGRLLFIGHQMESERPHRVRVRVSMEWKGQRYTGEAVGTDLPRSRLELLAGAVLQGLESMVTPEADDEEDRPAGVALSLDGVRVMDAFDRRYVLVGVHAVHGRHVTVLSGSAPVADAMERAVILATLQATDRWVRGRL